MLTTTPNAFARLRALLLALIAATLLFAAGCGDDDDDPGASGSASASVDEESETTVAGDTATSEDTAPLSEEEARAAGNPEVYARIAGLTDCAELEREKTAAETNAKNRADNPRRVSILESYAAAAAERMKELSC